MEALDRLQNFLDEGESCGVQIDVHVKKKLDAARQSVRDEKLRVVLVGGFSEGKTAIAAAWLEKLDKLTMKISHEESSNAIIEYDTGTDCILVDTPGLFGFKEQVDDATGRIEKYKELTQRHISQAHLILYVMDPTNPIKESHHDELNWMFRELALLPRTVFVLSRFDDVADLEDPEDYAYHVKIKRENVTNRLREVLALDDTETHDLAIVAVAANPFGKGTEYWLNHLDEFRQLSRIPLLQTATSEKIAQSGDAQEIVDAARRAIVHDILHTQLPVAVQGFEKISRETEKMQNMHSKISRELGALDKKAVQIKISLRDFVSRLFKDLILQAKNLSQDTFQDFFENNIGSEGVVLETTLKNAFEKNLASIHLSINNFNININTEVNHYNEMMKQYGKLGITHIINSGMINNATVLAARNVIVDGAKWIGQGFGKHIGDLLKFKPWGAVKFAKGANVVAASLGIAIEVWDSLQKHEQEKKFRTGIADMIKNLEDQRKDLLALIDSDNFVENFLPDLIQMRDCIEDLNEQLNAKTQQCKKFEHWRQHGEVIEAEFRNLH